MNDVDFSDCQFINENMRFMTYFDFCNNKKNLKEMFNNLDEKGKIFYKWYVYANIHMNETFKDRIWSYLNDYDEFGIELLNAKRFYKAK